MRMYLAEISKCNGSDNHLTQQSYFVCLRVLSLFCSSCIFYFLFVMSFIFCILGHFHTIRPGLFGGDLQQELPVSQLGNRTGLDVGLYIISSDTLGYASANPHCFWNV